MIKKPGSQSEVHHSEDGVSRDGRLREVHAGLFPVSLSDDPMGGCKLNATHPTRRLRLTDFPALKVELQDWKHKWFLASLRLSLLESAVQTALLFR